MARRDGLKNGLLLQLLNMRFCALHDGVIVDGGREVLQGLKAGALYKVAHVFKIPKAGRRCKTVRAIPPERNMQLCTFANRSKTLVFLAKIELRSNEGAGVVGLHGLAKGFILVKNGVLHVERPAVFASVVPFGNLFFSEIHVLSPFGVQVFLILTILYHTE